MLKLALTGMVVASPSAAQAAMRQCLASQASGARAEGGARVEGLQEG